MMAPLMMKQDTKQKKTLASASGDPDDGGRTLVGSEYGRRPDRPNRRKKTGGNDMDTDGFVAVMLLAGVIAVFIGGPLLFIWLLNTLFKVGIAYGLVEWFATSLLLVFMVVLIYIGSSLAKD